MNENLMKKQWGAASSCKLWKTYFALAGDSCITTSLVFPPRPRENSLPQIGFKTWAT